MSDTALIDQNDVGAWNQSDNNRYNKLPYYLMKATAAHREQHVGLGRLLKDTIPWTPNQGTTQKRVAVTGSPILRQQARPRALIEGDPLTDTPDTDETSHDVIVYEHEFTSKHFHYLPSFQDFFGGHVKPNYQAMLDQQANYLDFFYRTQIWEHSPYVYVCGVGLIEAPVPSDLLSTTTGKTNAWFLGEIATKVMEKKGYFDLASLYDIVHGASEEIGMTPYSGKPNENNDNIPLDEQYAALISKEVWLNWIEDPWLKENRPIDMNIVTKGFQGSFFGQAKAMRQGLPERYLVSDDLSTVSLPAPEERYTNGPLKGRIKRTLDYRRTSQIEVSYLFGGNGYSKMKVAPTPADFAAARDGKPFNWNGKPNLTKQFLIDRKDAAGTIRQVWNNGRYIRYESNLAMGIGRDNPQNVLPIVYLRRKPQLNA